MRYKLIKEFRRIFVRFFTYEDAEKLFDIIVKDNFKYREFKVRPEVKDLRTKARIEFQRFSNGIDFSFFIFDEEFNVIIRTEYVRIEKIQPKTINAILNLLTPQDRKTILSFLEDKNG